MMFSFFKQFFSSKPAAPPIAATARLVPESQYTVAVDANRIVCRHPSGKEESVTWEDLTAVIVETNDTGPWGMDVLWRLVGRDGVTGCVVPQGATGDQELLELLQKLPGFDNKQFIEAMTCAENQQFVCWRQSAAH